MQRRQREPVLHHVRRVAGFAAVRELSDAQLLERYVLSRDESAFATVVRRYGRLVQSVCRRVLHHDQDADDAFQVTFLILACKASSIRKASSLASWVYGVAYRTAMNAKRARSRRSKEQRQLVEGHSREQPVRQAMLREVQAIVDDEVNRLSEKDRAVFVLCCLEGKSKAEAAKQLDWREGTVSSRLARARKELQQRLARRGVELAAALCTIELGRTAAAAVDYSLLNTTIKAGLLLAAGEEALADLVSTKVAALAEEVVKAMFMSKMKSVVAALILGGALMSGTLVLFGKGLTGLPGLAAAQAPQVYPKSTLLSTPPGVPAARDGGEPKTELKPVVIREDAQVHQATWSADGKVVATVSMSYDVIEIRDSNGENPGRALSANSTVKLWDSKTHKLIRSLGEEKKTHINAIVFSPDKKHAAIAGTWPNLTGMPNPNPGPYVRIVDAETWAIKQQPDDVPPVVALAFSPDGKTLAMGGGSGYRAEQGSWVKLSDVQGEKIKGGTKLGAPPGPVPQPLPGKVPEWQERCLAFSPDGLVLAAGEWSPRSQRARIQLYDSQTGQPKQRWDIGESTEMLQVAFTADGKSLVSASGPVKFWNVGDGKELRTLETGGFESFLVAVSPDGRHLATSGFRKEKDKTMVEAFLWDAKSGELKRTLPWQDSSDPPIWTTSSLAFSPDGMTLAIGGLTVADLRVKDSEKTRGELKLVPLDR